MKIPKQTQHKSLQASEGKKVQQIYPLVSVSSITGDKVLVREEGEGWKVSDHAPFSIVLTVILTLFHTWFLLPFLFDFVRFLVNDLENGLGDLLLPALGDHKGEIFVELLV